MLTHLLLTQFSCIVLFRNKSEILAPEKPLEEQKNMTNDFPSLDRLETTLSECMDSRMGILN